MRLIGYPQPPQALRLRGRDMLTAHLTLSRAIRCAHPGNARDKPGSGLLVRKAAHACLGRARSNQTERNDRQLWHP